MSNENLGLGKDYPNVCAEVATECLIEASEIQHAQPRIDKKTRILLDDALHSGLVDRFGYVEIKYLQPNEMPVISHPYPGEDGTLGLRKTYVPNIVRYKSQTGAAADLLDCVTQLHDAVRKAANEITQPTIYIVYFDPVMEDDAWVLTAGVCVVTNDGVEHFGSRNVDTGGWMNLAPAKSDDDIVAAALEQQEHERDTEAEFQRRRHRMMLHIQVGDDNWVPSAEELQSICALFQGCEIGMKDGDTPVVVTRKGVEIQPSWHVSVVHQVHMDVGQDVEVVVQSKHRIPGVEGAYISRADGKPLSMSDRETFKSMIREANKQHGSDYLIKFE